MNEQVRLDTFMRKGVEVTEKRKEFQGPHDLPQGWKWVKLGEIVWINKEKKDPRKEMPGKEFIYIDISSIESGTGRILEVKKILGKDAPSRARRVIHTKDVIMSTVRPYLKSFAIIPEEYDGQICSTGFAVLSCKGEIIPKYLFYVLFSDIIINQCNEMMIGAHYPALRFDQVTRILIPLPPLEEQKRIVSKLEELVNRVEEAKRLRKIAREEAEKIMQATLHKVFSKAEEGWEQVKLGVLFKLANGKFITKRQISNRKEEPYIIPVYGSNGILGYTIRPLVNFDTIVIGRVGACGAINFAGSPCWISDNAMYIREYASNRVSLRFLYWLLKICNLSRFAKVSAHPSISQEPIKNLEVFIPPIREQERIVTYLNKMKETAESLKKLQQRTEEELEKLVPAILDRAFKGEL